MFFVSSKQWIILVLPIWLGFYVTRLSAQQPSLTTSAGILPVVPTASYATIIPKLQQSSTLGIDEIANSEAILFDFTSDLSSKMHTTSTIAAVHSSDTPTLQPSPTSLPVIPVPPPNTNPPTTQPTPTKPKVPPCPEERDRALGILWPRTPPGNRVMRPCPPTFIGRTSRTCRKDGTWSKVDIMSCTATTIEGVDELSNSLAESGEEDVEDTMMLLGELRNLTRPPPRKVRGPFLNRNNLRAIKDVSRRSLRLLRRQYRAGTNETDAVDFRSIFGLFSNALDSRNRESWEELQETESGSEEILSNAEEYASITASMLEQNGDVFRFTEDNLAMRAERIHSFNVTDFVFPTPDDITNTSYSETGNDVNNSTIKITSQYIEQGRRNDDQDVFISFLLFPTIQDFLPTPPEIDENVTIASVVLSAQVEYGNGTNNEYNPTSTTSDHLIELNFAINVSQTDNFTAQCVYWNFTDDFNSTSSGGWLSDGIVTELIDNSTVRCLSNHLTSFAVLVDVSGTYSRLVDSNIDYEDNETNTTMATPPIHLIALSYVSYIGTGVSVVCLAFTIIFLLSLKKEIFTKVHYLLHLNLAISLLLGFAIFIGGIQYASDYTIACKVVAVLLHYFFLSAFCWMLCEAVLLYLLIVIVFTSPAKWWYLFLLFGWGMPMVIVGASFGGFRNEYILDSSICWLNYSNNAIWTFTGPMCFIILLNLIVLVVVTFQLIRTKRKMRKLSVHTDRSRFHQIKNRRRTVKDLIKGVVVLLPLLGITWVVGLFALDENTLFFAWIFTILNSLQGFFIFLFHVLCSEKFGMMMKKWFKRPLVTSEITHSTHTTPMTTRKENYQLGKSEESLDKLSTPLSAQKGNNYQLKRSEESLDELSTTV